MFHWATKFLQSSAKILVLAILVALPHKTVAQVTRTWNGSSNSDWFNANNWTPTGVPATNDTINFSAGTIDLTAAVTINGQFNWSGGTLTGTPLYIATNGSLLISGSGAKFLQMPLTNSGTIRWQGGDLIVPNNNSGFSGAIQNLSGALFDIQCNQSLYNNYGGGSPYFSNAGVVQKSAGTGTTTISIPFNNSAAVSLGQGTLSLNGGGILEGTFTTANTTAVKLNGGNFTYSTSPAISGAGIFQLVGGNLALVSDVISNLQMVGGSVTLSPSFQGGTITNLTLPGATLNGNYTVSGTLTCGAGISGSLSVSGGGTFNWSGGNVSSSLSISSGGIVNWTGGSASGVVNVSGGATLVLGGTGAKYLQNVLTNQGTVTWTGGDLVTPNYNGGYLGNIYNLSGALWDIQCNQSIYNNYGGNSASFSNSGQLQKSAGSGTAAINIPFYNSGTVAVTQGTLTFNGGGTVEGAFNAGAGATLNFGGGNFTYTVTPVLSGVGTIQLTGGTLTLTTDMIPNLQPAGGSIVLGAGFQGGTITNLTLPGTTLSGDYTVTGLFSCGAGVAGSLSLSPGAILNWSGGTISGALNVAGGASVTWSGGAANGPVTVATNASFVLSGSPAKYLQNVLTNMGNVTWSGGDLVVPNYGGGYSGRIENLTNGVFDIECNQSLYNNYGSLAAYFRNQGMLQKTVATGTTTISIPLLNSTSVNVQTGILNLNGGAVINGNFTTAAGSSITLSSGDFTYSVAPSVLGSGTTRFTGGNLWLADDVIPNLQMTSGSVFLSTGFQGGAITNLTLTGVNLASTNILAGVLNLNGNLTGPLTMSANSTLNWNGGTVSSPLTVPAQAVLNIGGSSEKDIATILTNAGTINWTSGFLRVLYNNGVYNLAGADFEIQTDQTLGNYYGGEYFNNAGTFRKTTTTGTTTVSVVFNTSGNVDVESGTLTFAYPGDFAGNIFAAAGTTINFNNGGTLDGTFTSALGGNIYLRNGTFVNTATTQFGGNGNNVMTGGSLNLLSGLVPNLQMVGGTVSLSPTFQGGTITNLTLNGFTLNGTNTVTGVLNLSGSLNGQLTIASNAVLNWTGGTASGPVLLSPYATLNWSSGTMASPLTVPTNAIVNMLTGAEKDLAAALTNFGTITWSGGPFRLLYNNGFYNQPGGDFEVQCDQNIGSYYGGEFFNNAGLLRKSVTANTTTVGVNFNNSGTVEIDTGVLTLNNAGDLAGSFLAASGATLNFNGGGTLDGSYTAATGASIYFNNGTFQNTLTAQFSGPGSHLLTGGSLNLLTDLPANLQISGGTLTPGPQFQGGSITNLTLTGVTLAGSNYITGTLNLTGSISGPLLLASNAVLNWAGGSANGIISLTPYSTMNWAGGTVGQPLLVPTNATVNLVSGAEKDFAAPLTNAGAITWLAGNLRVLYNNGFYNLTGGLFEVRCDQNIGNYYGGEFFSNAGLFRKTAGNGTTTLGINFNNAGLVDVEAGTLQFNNGGDFAGKFQIAAGTTLTFNGGGTLDGTYFAAVGGRLNLSAGTFQNTPAAAFFGPGNYALTGGSFNLLNDVITNLQMQAGTVSLGPQFQGGSITNLTLNGLTLNGSNTVTGVLNFNGTLAGPLVVGPGGTMNWSGGTANGAFTVLSNGTLNLVSSNEKDIAAPWTNGGAVFWTAGNLRALYNNGMNNLAGGLFELLCDQTIGNYYGSEFFNNSGLVLKTNSTGTTTFGLNFNNYATLNAQTGRIFFSSGFAQTGGTWDIGISGPSAFGQIGFSGTARIASTLNVNLNNNFLPGLSNAFPIVTYSAVNGAFSQLNTPPGGLFWAVSYGGNAATLLVTNVAAPLLTITSPTNNSAFIGPLTLSLTATVLDTNASVAQVQFYNGSNLIGQASNPYTYIWNNAQPGLYSLTAQALDSAGMTGTSAPVNITVYSSSPIQTTNFAWTGATSTDWFIASNWSPVGIPGTLDNVILTNGGAVNLSANVAVNNVILTSGILQGAGLLSVTNTFTWSGGTIKSPLILTTNSTMVLNGVGNLDFPGSALTCQGTVLWNNGTLRGNNASVITNSGIWVVQTDNQINSAFGGAFAFYNLGTFQKLAGSGTTLFSSVAFNNSGTVDIRNGTVNCSAGGNFAGSFSITNGATFNISSGGLLTGNFSSSSGSAIYLSSGPFNYSPALTFSGPGTNRMTGGTLTLTNDIIPGLQYSGGTLALGPAFQGGSITNLSITGATLVGTNTVTGSLNWAAGSLNGSLAIAANGVLNLSSTASKNLPNSDLLNLGTIYWAGGPIFGDSNTSITNSGVWVAQSDDQVSLGNPAPVVNNGTFRKLGTTGITSLNNLTFINNGSVDAETGTIQFNCNGLIGGNYTAAAGCSVNFSGGSYSMAALPALTGGGTFAFTGGNITMLNDTVAGLNLAGGTITLGPAFQGGTITNLTLAGSTLAGTNTVAGVLNWQSGTLNGALTIAASGVLNLTTAANHDMPGTVLTNLGTINWNQGTWRGKNTTLVINNSLCIANSDDQFNNAFGGISTFINNGTFRKTATGGATTFNGVALNNTGFVDVEAGSLVLWGGGALGGTYNTVSGSTLDLANGSFTAAVTPNFTNSGVSQFTGGNLSLAYDQIPNLPLIGGTVTLGPAFQQNGGITNFTLSGSTLAGSNFITGTLNFLAGALNGSMTILTNAQLNLSGSANKDLPNTALVNQGTVLWIGGAIRGNSGTTITNNGLWLIQTDNQFNNGICCGNPLFVNHGIFRKSATTGSTLAYGISFLNSGQLDIESGSFNFTAGATYAQTGATLAFGLSAANLSGLFNPGGNLNVDGTLQLNLLNGYIPSAGDFFTLCQYSSHAGNFASLALPPLASGLDWRLEFAPSALTLRVVSSQATNNTLQLTGTVQDNLGNPIAGALVYGELAPGSFTNLIQNGSFELPSNNGSSYVLYPSGSTNIPGWTVTGPSSANIAIHNGFLGPPEDAGQYFDPSGSTGAGGIVQAFATTPGESYSLFFYHGTLNQQRLTRVLGVTVGTNFYTFGETAGYNGNLNWTPEQIAFVATSNITTIAFMDLTAFDANDAFVDDVKVVPLNYERVLQAVTDATGHYQLSVADGTWQLSVAGLATMGYNDVTNQTVTLNNANAVVNFVTTPSAGHVTVNIAASVNPASAGTTSGGGTFNSGATVTVTATETNLVLPYQFVNWTENQVVQSTNASYTFTASQNRQLVANFALPTYTISASTLPSGAGVVSGTGPYVYGTTNTLTAFPSFGYLFGFWSEGGNILSSNTALATVVYTNHSFVANFLEANRFHVVTTATSPTGLATVNGAGTYTNSQTGIFSTPSIVTNGSIRYLFQSFSLNGSLLTNAASFQKTFSTLDQANLSLVAQYTSQAILPVVLTATPNLPNPVGVTTNFIVKVQFDRTMNTNIEPIIYLTNAANSVQPVVPDGGTWSSTALLNDSYTTPKISFATGMDGTNQTWVSSAQDLYGAAVMPTNVLNVVIDTTFPNISGITVTPGALSAVIKWNTDKPSSSQADYGTTAGYGASTPLQSQLVTSHLITVGGLSPVTTYHFRVRSRDQAGNETISGDQTFATLPAPDLQVTNLAVIGSLVSGTTATITWNDINTGAGATFSYWYDRVMVTNITTGQVLLDTALYFDPSINGNIAPGSMVPRSTTVALPNGASGAGGLMFIITANVYGNQYEANLAGTAQQNNQATLSQTATLANYPDLLVTNLTASSTGLQSGDTLLLTWNDWNNGQGSVSAPYSDQITIVNKTTSKSLLNTVVSGAPPPVTSGQLAPRQYSFTLPQGLDGAGSLQIQVTCDSQNNIYEFNAAGTGENNNTATNTVISALAPYPDLVVTNVTGPAIANAGQTIQVSWSDINSGTAPATNVWNDQVFLSASNSLTTAQLLGTFAFTNGLPAGQSLNVTQTVTLPPFSAGTQYLVVKINADNAVFEVNNTNNTTVAASPLTIASTLTLTLNQSTVLESAGTNAVTATVSRNGDTTTPLLVSLGSSTTTNIALPSTVTIAAGQNSANFQISVLDNFVSGGTAVETITANATGFPLSTAVLNITENDVATLALSLSTSAVSEAAGAGAVTGTITRNANFGQTITVSLLSDQPTALQAPTTVTIPAGQQSATFAASPVNNNQVDSTRRVNLNASAPGFGSISTFIDVLNANTIQLSLQLADSTITKGAPSPATVGTVSRSPVLAGAQDVALTVQNDPLVSVPSIVTIPAGAASTTFNVSVGDDQLATGPQTATIIARPLSSARIPLTNGNAQISLNVLDKNGPTLSVSLANSSIAKGSNTVGTVTRNTPPTNSLTVTLSGQPQTSLTLPATVTIPLNQASATFAVAAVLDNTQTGSEKATVMASAAGYNSGSAGLVISDVYLPDLVPVSVTIPTNATTSAAITISYVVANNGLGVASNSWIDFIYVASDSQAQQQTFITSVLRTNPVPLGIGATYTNQASFFLPPTPGNYWITVVADATSQLPELNENNNTFISTQPIAVNAAYRASVSGVTPSLAPSGTPIQITGSTFNPVDNSPAPYRQATVRILVNGTRRVFNVASDANGKFSYVFQPLASEAGDYVVGADYPYISQDPTQGSFTLLGLEALPASLSPQLLPNVPLAGQILLSNLSAHPLSGLSIAVPDLHGNLNAQFTLTNTSLPANGSMMVGYTLQTPVTQRAQLNFSVAITSTEGAQTVLPVNSLIVPLQAQLSASPAYLNHGMLVGQQTLVTFDIFNSGGTNSGDLTVQLPSFPWLTLASPAVIPSIPSGGKATVTLALNPAPDLPLTIYQGNLAVANGLVGVNIPFQFRAVSESKGDLRVTVTDDYTYYVSGAPNVTNATVTVRDSFTGDIIAQTNSDANGIAYFSGLFEGPYTVDASAPKHNPYRGAVSVVAGVTTDLQVFMPRQLVTYQWSVVPTEIPDNYKVVLQSVFETEVPVPNVVVEEPKVLLLVAPGQVAQFDIKLRNEGLIAANGVSITVPSDPNYLILPLVTNVGVIPAKSEMTIPVTVQLRSTAAAAQAGIHKLDSGCSTSSFNKCVPDIPLGVNYYYTCGPNNVLQQRSVDLSVACTANSVWDCLQKFKDLAGSANMLSWGCSTIAAFLSCTGTDIDPCLMALIDSACGAATGALEGGPAGAAAGALSGGAGDLLQCACEHLSDIPLPSIPPSSGGGGGGDWLLPILPTGSYYVSGAPVVTGSEISGSDCSGTGPNVTAVYPKPLKIHKTGATTGVCAHVRIEIDQSVTMTRSAFKGTLEIDDGGSTPITNIQVTLDFRDATNGIAADKFVVEGPVLSGLSAVDGTGILAGGATGSAVYTFIPTDDAAPNAPATFQIGGTLSYYDGGEQVVVPLLSAPITVYPQAKLKLVYFQQRDVYADDPFTPEIEPSEPFALGLIVKNVGAGSAHNFQITSGQPQIVDNQKGLLIDFKIIGTEVGSDQLTPSLTANLGDIPSGGAKEVTWEMLSTLQGKFVSFDATFEHVDDLGKANISLIDSVEIHELIHKVQANRPGDDAVPDFLVNDIPEPASLPDILYLSDGSVAPVASFTNAVADAPAGPGHMQVQITATMTPGWNYLQFPDPGPGYLLGRVVRSDGQEILLTNNVWTTDRTFPSSMTGAIREHLVHLLDWNGTGTYTLYYRPTNITSPTIEQLVDVAPFNQTGAVSSVTIVFSEPVDTSTFDYTSVSLTRNGGTNLITNASGIALTLLSNSTYSITGLQGLTSADGNYQLTVTGGNILDLFGNAAGATSASTAWAKGNVPAVVQSFAAISPAPRNVPVTSVDVTFSKSIAPGSIDYNALVLTLNAGPNLITSNVTVTAKSGNVFTIGGLGPLTGAQGTYVLTVNATAVQDLGGTPGVGSKSTTWDMITTGPSIVALEQLATNPRNIVVMSLDVTFSEPVAPTSFDYADLNLSLNGGPNLITRDVTVTPLNSTTFRIANFNWVVGSPGSYTLSINAAGVMDLAGNAGTGLTNETWQMVTAIPPTPTNLVISPDLGISSSDGLTCTNTILLSGTVAGTNLTIRIGDATTALDLGVATTIGTNFSALLNFTTLGAHQLKVIAVDPAGNVSPQAAFNLFVDTVPPTAVLDQISPNPHSGPVTNIAVSFSKAINPATLTAGNFVLSLNGTNLPTSLSVSQVSSNVFLVGGLQSATAAVGSYQLALNLTGIQDLAGNQTTNVVSTTWQTVSPNQPPLITQVPAQTVAPGQLLQVAVEATDPNGNSFAFSLDPSAPLGATISPSGAFAWTPSCVQGSATYPITVWATDNGTPVMSNSMTFLISVGDCVRIGLGDAVVQTGQSTCVPLNLYSSGVLTNVAFTLVSPSNRFANWSITTTNPMLASATAQAIDPSQTAFGLASQSGATLKGTNLVAWICFNALTNRSAFVSVAVTNITTLNSNGVPAATTFGDTSQVVVIGREPLLQAGVANPQARTFILYGNPGATYSLQYRTNFTTSVWTEFRRLAVTNLVTQVSSLPNGGWSTFYRAVEISYLTMSLTGTNLYAGETAQLPLTLTSALDLTNISFTIALPASPSLTNLSLQALVPEVTSASLQPLGPNTFTARLSLNPSLRVGSTRTLAQLSLSVTPTSASGIALLGPGSLLAQSATGQSLTNGTAQAARVIVVGPDPVLDLSGNLGLTLYGRTGHTYSLRYRTNLVTGTWVEFNRINLTGRFLVIPNNPVTGGMLFYEAVEVPGASLTLRSLGSPRFSFALSGTTGSVYRVQAATNLNLPVYWADLFSVNLTNSPQSIPWTNNNNGQPRLFFRAVSP